MKNKLQILVAMAAILLLPKTNFGQAPNLGAVASYAIFTSAGAFNNTGSTTITGDAGTQAGAFNGSPTVIGQIHVADAHSVSAANALGSAYSSLSGVTCGVVIGTTMGNSQVLTPNVYCMGAAATLNGTLTLNALGNPNAIFIFKINGAFATTASSNIVLINGANLSNVYWQVNGAFATGAGSNFKGNVLANGAISINSGTSFVGRALTIAGAIDITNSSVSMILDADNDGVSDVNDQYPNDQYKAFNNNYPAANFSTLLFEDLWPSIGDYDFNDLVVDYRFNTVTNATNNVVEVIYTFVTRAIGGSLHNGFAFQLDGINSNKITSVSGSKAVGASWISLNANGTEAGHINNTNILAYDDAYKIMQSQAGFSFINVDPNAPISPNDTTIITVKFLINGVAPIGGTLSYDSFPTTVFNPYMIINQDRGKELHLTDRMPSAKMNATYFGTEQDKSNVSLGEFYKTENNLPWALNVGVSIPFTIEKTDFSLAYLKFVDWASSGGVLNPTWYLNTTGNRDNTKLIIR
jgi:LruC domain-containing protein